VELYAFTGGALTTGITNSSGAFAFSGLRSGNYYVTVESPGYEATRVDVNFSNHPPVALQVMLRPAGSMDRVPVGDVVSTRQLSIPRRAREAMERGLEQMHGKSNYQGSLQHFERAIREYPQYYEAYAQMGVAHMYMGDAAKAEELLRTSIEMSEQTYAEGYSILASVYSTQKRFTEAEDAARQAVGLDAQSARAQHELARALHGLDLGLAAEAAALEAVRLDPSGLDTRLLLANIHLRMRNYAALLKDLDLYLEMAPDGPDAAQARQMRAAVIETLARVPAQ
jgi:tetratricopeptide (TPR) repeat protein